MGCQILPFFFPITVGHEIKAKKFLKARDSYVAAIDIKPAYDAPYQNLGALYIKIGQLDVGKDNLEKAYKLDPRNDELRMYLRQFKSKEFIATSKVLTLDGE